MRVTVFIVLLIGVLTASGQERRLTFDQEVYDFGIIPEAGGPVEHTFLFTNSTDRPVKIISVNASCGCTTPGWTTDSVPPGGAGYVKAVFDPEGRPGHFSKSLSVTTDLDGKPIVLQITGIVQTARPLPGEFTVAKGAWRMRNSVFNMGVVLRTDTMATRTFSFYNAGTEPVSYLLKAETPPHISVEVTPLIIEPGMRGNVVITYNGKLKDAYGFHSDNITLYTSDPEMEVKSFTVYATLEDDFSRITQADLDQAPDLRITNQPVDFDRIRQHKSYTREIPFSNSGKSELEIRAIQANCDCVHAYASDYNLKPGESATLFVTFNPGNRLGTQQKSVMIYTNNPREPVTRVVFTAYVEN